MEYAIKYNEQTTKHINDSLSGAESYVINNLLHNKDDGASVEIRVWGKNILGERRLLSVITKDRDSLHHTHNGYKFNV